MGCGGRKSKYDDVKPEQKWDFISLNDFKSTSCFEVLAYMYLWVSLLISVAVYAVDTFTAVNLLAFDKYTGITPYIELKISKWIFSGCIILSWLNLGYEQFRAYRVIRRGAVAESFLDSLAVRLQCIRIGKNGRGWRRFLVFAELTKSKKGAEYVALFTYFSFQSWIRVIFCSGPRQVINGSTLYSVLKLNVDASEHDAGQWLLSFFRNVGALAEKDKQQAVILSGMLFTLVIWIFAVLSLVLAVLFYIVFLWHYIPNADGGLLGYCERKVNKKLTKIVSAKVNKALEDEDRQRLKDAQKAAGKGEKPMPGRQATVPNLDGGKLEMHMMGRNDTMSTLPKYSSRPGTPSGQQPQLPGLELSNLDKQRPYGARMATNTSVSSMASNAPLMAGASEMGYGGRSTPAPSVSDLEMNYPTRTNTSNSNFSRPGQPPLRGPTPLSRQQIQDGYFPSMDAAQSQDMYVVSPVTLVGSPTVPMVMGSNNSYGRPGPTQKPPAVFGAVEMPAPGSTPGSRYAELAGNNNDSRGASPSPYRNPAAVEMQAPGSTPAARFAELSGGTNGRASPSPYHAQGAVEMPAPGSTPGARFAELSASGINEQGRQSPAPFNNQQQVGGVYGGQNPIPRMPLTASPSPMTPAPGSGNPYQRSVSAGPGQSGNVNSPGYPRPPPQSQQRGPAPYRNMTEPVPMPQHSQGHNLHMPSAGTPQGQGWPGNAPWQGHSYTNSGTGSDAGSMRNGNPLPLQPPGGYRR